MIRFDPRDLWVGIYWNNEVQDSDPLLLPRTTFHLYVCVVPCFPIHLTWTQWAR